MSGLIVQWIVSGLIVQLIMSGLIVQWIVSSLFSVRQLVYFSSDLARSVLGQKVTRATVSSHLHTLSYLQNGSCTLAPGISVMLFIM